MILFAGGLIVVIVIVVIAYVLRTVRKNVILAKKRESSQNYFLSQVSNFTLNSSIMFNRKDDLFSKSRMINAGIEVIGEDIQLVDYVKNVPWFFYL